MSIFRDGANSCLAIHLNYRSAINGFWGTTNLQNKTDKILNWGFLFLFKQLKIKLLCIKKTKKSVFKFLKTDFL